MRLRLTLPIALLLIVAPLQAQRVTTFEQLTVGATAVRLASATVQKMSACSFRLETAQIRFRIDAAPTTTVGTLLEIGDVLVISNITDAERMQFIRTGAASGVLDVHCWPQP